MRRLLLLISLVTFTSGSETTTVHVDIQPRNATDGKVVHIPIMPREEKEEEDRVVNLPSARCGYIYKLDSGEDFILRSPNYPNNYPNNVYCYHQFKIPPGNKARLSCPSFKTEIGFFGGCKDTLLIDTTADNRKRRYCGSQLNGKYIDLPARNYETTISTTFTSNLNTRRKGFDCRLYTTPVVAAPPPPPPPSSSYTAGCNCGVGNNRGLADRIVNGSPTKAHQYPWTVGLVHNYNLNTPFCGGTIISKSWVLTAAHCVEGQRPGDFRVLAGDHDIKREDNGDRRLTVKEIVRHSGYINDASNGLIVNDFALLELHSDFDFSRDSYVRPACLPSYTGEDYRGYTGIAAGWGTLAFMSSSRPRTLQEIFVNVQSNSDCGKFRNSDVQIRSQHICAYSAGKDTCQGDSGGPLTVLSKDKSRYTLIGVTSFGFKCAEPGYPGIYARVTSVLGWIHSIVRNEICYP